MLQESRILVFFLTPWIFEKPRKTKMLCLCVYSSAHLLLEEPRFKNPRFNLQREANFGVCKLKPSGLVAL